MALYEARALVIDMCTGQLEQPNIPASRLVLNDFATFYPRLFYPPDFL